MTGLALSIGATGCWRNGATSSAATTTAPVHLITEKVIAAAQGTEAKVLTAMQSNRAKCPNRAVVRWKLLSSRSSPDGKPTEYRGAFEQWWDGAKIATRYTQQVSGANPDGTFVMTTIGNRSAFDGAEFRTVVNSLRPGGIETHRTPHYRPGESWLQMTGWAEGPDFVKIRESSGVKVTWTEEARNDIRVAKRVATNTADGASAVDVFDLEHGGEHIESEMHDTKGRPYGKSTFRLEQIVDGVWFPVEVNEESFNPETGTLQSRSQYAIVRQTSVFGPSAEVDPLLFELPPYADVLAAVQ